MGKFGDCEKVQKEAKNSKLARKIKFGKIITPFIEARLPFDLVPFALLAG